MSAALFVAMDKAHDMGLSEDERTDIHVAGLCAYRDMCIMGMFDLIRSHPEKISYFHKNSSMNAVMNFSKFSKLTERIPGFDMKDVNG